jgi:hypothetical protein
MEYITLPGTALRVSRICLGTQQFANSWEWPMDQETATATVQVPPAEHLSQISLVTLSCNCRRLSLSLCPSAFQHPPLSARRPPILPCPFPLWHCRGPCT